MTNKEALKIVANSHLGWTCSQYDSALTIVRNALDKQTPIKPDVEEFDYGDGYVCGNCGSFLHYIDDDVYIRTNYCSHCGQKVTWKK